MAGAVAAVTPPLDPRFDHRCRAGCSCGQQGGGAPRGRHPRPLDRLARVTIPSGATAGIAGLTAAADRLDGCVDADALPRFVTQYRLAPDPGGNATLRTTSMPTDVLSDLAGGRHHVLAGLDLAGSTDARERSAGHRLLQRAVGRLGG